MYLDLLQTMNLSYKEICQGERPWTALGNFMNDWYEYHKDRRPDLIAEPLTLPDPCPPEMQKWAAFCAASVEWFCSTYGVPCPTWVHDSMYNLPEPWFTRQSEKVRQWLINTTPSQFSKRNIFCGNRMFLNKYEPTTSHQKEISTATETNSYPQQPTPIN